MKNIKLIMPLLMTLCCVPTAQSATNQQLSAIAEMGSLNGVALQCRYLDQMQRIKMTLVLHLPKQRELGDWFEQTTNNSFMDFMNKELTCPDEQGFEQQVDAAVNTIETAFRK